LIVGSGAALLKRVSAALEDPRLSTEAFQDQSQAVPAIRVSVEAALHPNGVESAPMGNGDGVSKAVLPTPSHGPHDKLEAAVQTGVTSEPLSPGKPKNRFSLNPFASRSSTKLAAEKADPRGSDAEATATGGREGHYSANNVSVEIAPKLGRKLSKKQHRVNVSDTAASVKNILSGDLSSVSGPKVRASKLVSSQTKIAPQLLHDEKANKIISEIRQLSPLVQPEHTIILTSSSNTQLSSISLHAPPRPPAVHGVCLEETDEEADAQAFSKLAPTAALVASTPPPSAVPPKSTVSPSIYTLADVLARLKLVNFLQIDPTKPITPPAASKVEPPIKLMDNEATLMGALPSPAVVANGVNDLATQLIALGLGDPKLMLATTPDLNGLLPDHSGVYPPTDRMSVITCEFDILLSRAWMALSLLMILFAS